MILSACNASKTNYNALHQVIDDEATNVLEFVDKPAIMEQFWQELYQNDDNLEQWTPPSDGEAIP